METKEQEMQGNINKKKREEIERKRKVRNEEKEENERKNEQRKTEGNECESGYTSGKHFKPDKTTAETRKRRRKTRR